MNGLVRLQAAAPVVDLKLVVDHLRIDDAGEQARVARYLSAATRFCEQRTNRAFGEQRWQLSMRCFKSREIALPLPPLRTVQSVSYLGLAGQRITLPSDAYYVDPARFMGVVGVESTSGWPSTLERADAIQIEFTCGYQVIDDDLVGAILLLTGHFYQHREAASSAALNQIPFGVDALLAPYVVPVSP